MTMPQSVAEIFEHHVTLEAQGVDRMYLSFCVRRLQPDEGMLGFVRRHCDHRMDSKRVFDPLGLYQSCAVIIQSVFNVSFPAIYDSSRVWSVTSRSLPAR
jgi:hypothetical protein